MNKLNAVACLLLGCCLSFPAAARLYKWVDDKGVTHYGEVIPPEYANKDRSELSTDGRVMNTNQVLTPDQMKVREETLKKQRADEEALVEQKRRDNALLSTFSNVAEIDASKARSLQQVDGMINSISVQIKITQTRLEGLQAEEKNLKAVGKEPSASLKEDLKETQSRLIKKRVELEKSKTEKLNIETRFEADKARYRLLTTGGQ
jgi:hypothetical protein